MIEFSEEIQWRVEVMRPQIPSDGGIPFLIVRPDAPVGKEAEGRCRSCGDPLPPGPPVFCPTRSTPALRCEACRQAAWIAIFGSYPPSLEANEGEGEGEENEEGLRL